MIARGSLATAAAVLAGVALSQACIAPSPSPVSPLTALALPPSASLAVEAQTSESPELRSPDPDPACLDYAEVFILVRDWTGVPLADAVIGFESRDARNPTTDLGRVTGADGTFSGAESAGPWVLTVARDGYLETSRQVFFHRGFNYLEVVLWPAG